MPNNEHKSPTYDDLSQTWGLEKALIQKAREANTEVLLEGQHFERDPEAGGALRFSPEGQAILAQSLGLELQAEPKPEAVAPEQPAIELSTELGETMAQQMAQPAAIAFFRRFPAAVAAEVRRMVESPTEEEAPLVYGAMRIAMAGATDPKALLNPSQEAN